MGEPLYEQVIGPGGLGRACRIYAPVGTHETLLAYLVRRLLENGANTSFVNRVADESLPMAELVEDPVRPCRRCREDARGSAAPGDRAAAIAVRPQRANSRGLDLADEPRWRASDAMSAAGTPPWVAQPMLGTDRSTARRHAAHAAQPGRPREAVGTVRDASADDVEAALASAVRPRPTGPPPHRPSARRGSTRRPTGSRPTSRR